MEANGNEVGRYESHTAGSDITMDDQFIQLAPYEDLLGIYGEKDAEDYFTSFGFVVKVKPTIPSLAATAVGSVLNVLNEQSPGVVDIQSSLLKIS